MTNYRRIYAIPDIHGRLDLLEEAIKLMAHDGYNHILDLVVFLGDMIDRGSDSKGVINTIRMLQNAWPNVIALRGNHESFCIDFYTKRTASELYAWAFNGGNATKDSYGGDVDDDTVKWLASLPLSFEAQGFFFSHAPVLPEYLRPTRAFRDKAYSLSELTWTYFGYSEEKNLIMPAHPGVPAADGSFLTGVCGHIHRGSSVREVRIYPKYRMLDCGSGCFLTGRLAVHECIENRTLYADPLGEE